MSPFVRKVPAASGATAVQIADKTGGKYRIVEHLGSARTPEDLAALIEAGKAKLRDPGQATLDFETVDRPRLSSAVVKSSRSGLLVDTIRSVYERLGFDIIDDEAFFQLVVARLVEPTSKSGSVRVLDELGVEVVHRNTFFNCLLRANERDYRGKIAEKCFAHSVATTGISLLLYDVTTLLCRRRHNKVYADVLIMPTSPALLLVRW
jgi:hypothetical protein